MKNRFLIASALACLALLSAFPALAQFVPGQVLTAGQLNSAFSTVLSKTGGALSGPLSGTTATFASGQFSSATIGSATIANGSINGGTVSGLSAPIGFASGGTNATTSLGVTSNIQFKNTGTGSVMRSVQDKLADIIDVADFGARCNGVADDTAAINAALTYVGNRGPGTVRMSNKTAPCMISGTLTIPAGVTLSGSHGQSAGIAALLPNINPLIALTGNGSALRGTYINAAVSGTANTSGTAIAMSDVVGGVIDDVYLQGPFIGVDLNGNQPLLSNSIINGISGTGSIGIRVGLLTNSANTVDARILHTTVVSATASPADANLVVLDAGGLIMESSDLILAKIGTLIAPGANQHVLWTSFSNTYVGDTNTQYALKIDTASSSATVYGLQCNGCWTSSAGLDNILVTNTAGGGIAGLYFIGLRNYSSHGNGAHLHAGSNIAFDSSHFCGNSNGGANIIVDAAITGLAIRNSDLGAGCGGLFSTTPSFAILLGALTTQAVITGNDLTGPTNAFGGSPAGNSVVANNIGLDTAPSSVVSAASINLGVAPVAVISGTTGINTIQPTWNGRTVTLITKDGAIAFGTSGNICAAFTSTQNVPVTAYFGGTCWYLK
ncbi:glycoside hydrolase family 55 protein [Burkholderia sp. Ap-962]|uniref:beta strand repeat-containing protein n=1 Tax=Burkholderia sp. Ap-962 TaxID=2608333 RepID=UPI001F03C7BE|nr:glycoside hydrolase family 55 protein [Burkholderia sp. Ap-962]